jgi:hypothetical protein
MGLIVIDDSTRQWTHYGMKLKHHAENGSIIGLER